MCYLRSKIEQVYFMQKIKVELGIDEEIISTPSHSADSVTVMLDDGTAITGDLEPQSYIDAYADNEALKADWEKIMSYHPRRICHAHANEVCI